MEKNLHTFVLFLLFHFLSLAQHNFKVGVIDLFLKSLVLTFFLFSGRADSAAREKEREERVRSGFEKPKTKNTFAAISFLKTLNIC